MRPDLTNIKNIIFDLGKVLLNLDFEATINAFRKIGFQADIFNNNQIYADPVFHDFETGKITVEEFCNGIRRLLNNSQVTDEQILDAWSAMIGTVPEQRVLKLAELKEKYQVFLFSNTNQVHIEWFHKSFEEKYGFAFSSLFVKDYYSYEIHDSKPNVTSYMKVIELSGVSPCETLFVDDLNINIDAAQKAGFRTFWLQSGMEMSKIF